MTAAGGTIRIDTEARVTGDSDWTLMSNSDWTVKGGELECALVTLANENHPNITKGTEIELRCRYLCMQPEMDDFYSDYSQVISFNTTDIKTDNIKYEDSVIIEDTKSSCPICHFCPQPLGLCIFIWLLIILVLIVIIVVIVVVSKKSKKESKGNRLG